ncbi:MAG: hypothetical protein PF638_04300 [Candidatus Delongbacteria bacterium]|jgi:hypothetical protein|nr:hypothetical protein [Candidatus Delongbacteria bacterium]
MEKQIVNRYTDAELKDLLIEKGIKEEECHFFMKHYEIAFNDFSTEQYESIEEKEEMAGKPFKDIVLDFVFNHCLKPFNKQIKLGHSKEWVFKYIDKNYSSEDIRAFLDIYKYFLGIDKELAMKELKVYCKNYNNDEKFLEYLLKQFSEGEYEPYQFGKADKYSKVYKEQIEKGKPQLYSDKYADFAANAKSPIECHIYAKICEKLIMKGKSESHAEYFAWIYFENIGKDLHLYSAEGSITGCFVENDRDDDDFNPEGMKNYFYQNAVAEVYASNYTLKNRIENGQKFIEKYKGNYFGIHSKNERENNGKSEEQLHELALKETLDEFQKLGYK